MNTMKEIKNHPLNEAFKLVSIKVDQTIDQNHQKCVRKYALSKIALTLRYFSTRVFCLASVYERNSVPFDAYRESLWPIKKTIFVRHVPNSSSFVDIC